VAGIARDDEATCTAEVFGHRVRMRCDAGARIGSEAFACLRDNALRVVNGATPGVRATITSIVYQGGRFRLDAAPERAPGVPLHFGVAEPCSLRPGDTVTLAIDDGWVLPHSAARGA
jgi:iron(III) transport system ATP-binding protein